MDRDLLLVAILMQLTLNMSWLAIDASKPNTPSVRIPAGKHAVERIPNPFIPDGEPWLVLRGTKIGASEAYWKSWLDDEWGDFSVDLDGAPS